MNDFYHRRLLRAPRIATTLIFLVQGMGIGAWAVCVPTFRETLGLSNSSLSLSLLAFAIGGLLGMPASAWLVSRLGSKSATMLLALAYGICIVLPALAPSLFTLVGAALLFGLSKGAVDVAMNTFGAAIQTNWRAPIMSSFHAAASSGGFFGAVWIGVVFANGFEAFTGLLTLTVVSLVLVGAAIRLAIGADVDAAHDQNASAFAVPSSALMGIGSLCFLVLLIEGAITDWSGVFMTTVVQVTSAQAAAGFAAFSTLMVFGRVFGDWFVSTMGPHFVVRFGAIMAAIGFTLALVFASFGVTVLGFALVGLGASNLFPLLLSAASEAKDVAPSVAIAMTATVGYSGFLIGPPMIGLASDHVGLRMALVCLLIAAVLIGAFGPKFIEAVKVT